MNPANSIAIFRQLPLEKKRKIKAEFGEKLGLSSSVLSNLVAGQGNWNYKKTVLFNDLVKNYSSSK